MSGGDVDGAALVELMEDLRSFLATNVEVNGRPLGSAVTLDQGYQPDGLGVVIVPPLFAFDSSVGFGPSSATSTVVVLAPNDANHVGNLMALTLGIADAIDRGTHHTVQSASPGTWLAGSRMIPMYALDVSLDLSDI